MNIGTKYRHAMFSEELDFKVLVYEIMYPNYGRNFTLTFIHNNASIDCWSSTKPIGKDRYNIL